VIDLEESPVQNAATSQIFLTNSFKHFELLLIICDEKKQNEKQLINKLHAMYLVCMEKKHALTNFEISQDIHGFVVAKRVFINAKEKALYCTNNFTWTEQLSLLWSLISFESTIVNLKTASCGLFDPTHGHMRLMCTQPLSIIVDCGRPMGRSTRIAGPSVPVFSLLSSPRTDRLKNKKNTEKTVIYALNGKESS